MGQRKQKRRREEYLASLPRVQVRVAPPNDPSIAASMRDMMADLAVRIAEAQGDRVPLELRRSIQQAPDDDARQRIVTWAAAHGHDVLEYAATRPTVPYCEFNPAEVFDEAWRQGRSIVGEDDESDVPLQAWLFHREAAEVLRRKIIGQVIKYDEAGILKTQRLLRETLTECGAEVQPDGTLGYVVPGNIPAVQINLTISTGGE